MGRQRTYTKSTQVALGGASAILWTRVPSASALVFTNTHATQVAWVDPTGGTAVLNDGIRLAPSENLVFGDDADLPMPASNVTGIASGAGTNISVFHANY